MHCRWPRFTLRCSAEAVVLTGDTPGALNRAGGRLAEILPVCDSDSEDLVESKEYEDPVGLKSYKKTHSQENVT